MEIDRVELERGAGELLVIIYHLRVTIYHLRVT